MNPKTHNDAAHDRLNQDLDTAYKNGYRDGEIATRITPYDLGEAKKIAFHDGYTMGQRNANESRLTASQFHELQEDNRRLRETVCNFKDDILKKHGEISKLTSDLQSAGAQIGALQKENAEWRKVSDEHLKKIEIGYKNGFQAGQNSAMKTVSKIARDATERLNDQFIRDKMEGK